jgi:hypothetical protein
MGRECPSWIVSAGDSDKSQPQGTRARPRRYCQGKRIHHFERGHDPVKEARQDSNDAGERRNYGCASGRRSRWRSLCPSLPRGPGGSCTHGYSRSGSFCLPRAGAQDAIPLPPNGTCPHGWTRSGSFCLRSAVALIHCPRRRGIAPSRIDTSHRCNGVPRTPPCIRRRRPSAPSNSRQACAGGRSASRLGRSPS